MDALEQKAMTDVERDQASEPSEHQQNLNSTVDELPSEKAPPESASTGVVDGGIKGWIIAFGGFCCL
jgi:hypothetical protein